MLYLLAVSLLWGFSFGLVKTGFSELDPSTLAMARLAIALPCFLPFFRLALLTRGGPLSGYLLTGAVQYGLMYVALFHAFRWLSGYEVALLTIFTPFYVILSHAALNRRIPPPWFWATALIAVIAALWILDPRGLPTKGPGVLLVQLSNICFAFGQVLYPRLYRKAPPHAHREGYALLYAGGVLATLPFALTGNPIAGLSSLDAGQWMALLYLGAVASGLGFFLWNAGAARVNPASLAVFNNLKIPIAILISVTVFGETADPLHLVPGLFLLLVALLWSESASRREPTSSG
jgi:drug/metabolite transporter (DMT)-like permease